MPTANTFSLLVLLLILLSATLFAIVQAEGGFGEFPRLVDQACPPCAEFIFGSE